MSLKNKKIISIFLSSLFLLLLLKVDYRFKEINSGGAQDDSSYYYHAQTVAIDFDLDYRNQLNGNFQDAYIRKDGKPVPRQSFGPGLLSAPFLLLSNSITNFISVKSNTSLNYFIYSLSSLFYLFLSLLFLKAIMINLNKFEINKLLLFTFGSGVTYYAFERFSMSTIYEFFSISVVLFISHKVKDANVKAYYIFFLPVVQFIMLTIRWNNLHLFLIPIFYLLLFKENLNILFRNVVFYLGNLVGIFIFLLHTKLLYGIYTFSQRSIYPTGEWVVNQRLEKLIDFSNLSESILISIRYLLVTCFSFEFGIFYFSAIVFVSFYFLASYLSNKNYKLFFVLGLFYLIPFLPILVFENHGTSYGFRYLFTIIPINLIIYFKEFSDVKPLSSYLFIFSIFGILSQLFFESTSMSSLSEFTIQNSFGSYSPYSNPTYLIGVFESMIEISAYLKIFFTSFVGVFLVKSINSIIDFETLLTRYYVVDEKLSKLLDSFESYSWIYLIFTILLLLYSSKILLSNHND